MVAEPLEKGLGEDIEKGKAGRCPVHGRPRAQSWQVSIEWNKRRMSDFFTKNYDWDSMQLDNLQSRFTWRRRGPLGIQIGLGIWPGGVRLGAPHWESRFDSKLN